jgi:hypothetical protein
VTTHLVLGVGLAKRGLLLAEAFGTETKTFWLLCYNIQGTIQGYRVKKESYVRTFARENLLFLFSSRIEVNTSLLGFTAFLKFVPPCHP